ncbi:DUF4184 family protein [Saccharothrix australiensis]|uniref:DUF4184 family protein n=1 Tax=Saccharothrix australiensis TaxID=2072 RepID=UPI001476FA89|nr:DUF4184 family protein [Saccharothrix australiensis]
MPFTVSHIAAAIPLAVRPLVPSALVAGAVAPDLPYFVLLYPGGGEYTHTWWGMVLVDVPIALVALLVYRLLLLEPALALAPAGLRSRVAWLPAPRFGVAAVVSALVGSATHLGWDGFTHERGWAVLLVPELAARVGGVPLYALGQWASTALGGLVVVVWGLRRLAAMPRRPVPARFAPPDRPAPVVALVAVFTAVFAAVTTTGRGPADVLVSASITVVSGALAALALYGLWRALRRRGGHATRVTPPARSPRRCS